MSSSWMVVCYLRADPIALDISRIFLCNFNKLGWSSPEERQSLPKTIILFVIMLMRAKDFLYSINFSLFFTNYFTFKSLNSWLLPVSEEIIPNLYPISPISSNLCYKYSISDPT